MKIVNANKEGVGFKPITLEVTIETQEELDALEGAFGALEEVTVGRDLSEKHAIIVVNMLEKMYESI